MAIVAAGLRKRLGGRDVVAGIGFRVERGECFGILGPNGAGKTTTMRMLSCLAERDGGELAVLGLDPSRDGRALRARIGVVAQETTLDLELSVRENLLVFARYFGISRAIARRRADDLLALMDLADRAGDPVDRLSGGMQRRLQLARALINEPELVILDEPTTGLDPVARLLVWRRLRELGDRGVTIILTTHYMDEADRLCDRLAMMDAGRILTTATPARIVTAAVGRLVIDLAGPDAAVAADVTRLAPVARLVRREPGSARLYAADGDAARSRATGAATLARIREASLEDAFVALTGRGLDAG